VLAAIEQLRTQGNAEDDRIEFKREWPEPTKARQLGAAANRAAGSYLIYVIGVDDQTGAITSPGATDPARWGAQMVSRFDQVAPDLLRHINIYLEDGSAVTALLFSTERAPYVVKSGGGSPELEVPIRDGTRTRSARRAELLRLLVPAVSVPPTLLLDAQVSGEHRFPILEDPTTSTRAQKASINLWGSFSAFVEFLSAPGILLAAHEMEGQLSTGDLLLAVGMELQASEKDLPPAAFGVHVRHDGVAVTGPGGFRTRLSIPRLPLAALNTVKNAEELKLRLSFGVIGARLPIRVEAVLTRDRPRDHPLISSYYERLPTWSFKSGNSHRRLQPT
jgi:hypothetical protein